MANTAQIMGLGGSLRAASTSRTALEVALQATTAAGAHARLVWVRDLDLPLYTADFPVPRPVREFVDAVYACDAMIWSSPTDHGSVSGSFKNALDWLILLAERDPPPGSGPLRSCPGPCWWRCGRADWPQEYGS